MTRISLGGAVLRGTVSTALIASLMSDVGAGCAAGRPEQVVAGICALHCGHSRISTRRQACAKVTPLDYKGRLTFWYQGVFEGDPDLLRQYYKDFFETFRKTYPNIQLEEQALTYNDLLDKFRTALLGNAAPMAVRLQILGGTEFASKGYLEPLKPEDVGYSTEDFWPGAMKAVTWEGVTYGIPTNNETMALIWNADIFKRAGLDPDNAPATWDDVVKYSKQIHDKLGIAGYGLVARKNAGNTPYRFMPQLWGYGGGVFDEADPSPNYGEVRLNSDASKRALQASYDMYVRDKSVPVSALTNQQADNQPLFVAGQLGMMISHPSDYNVMLDLQKKATGADKDKAQTVIDNMRYGLIPTGPDGKRAVVFGGSNIHILKPEYVEGGKVDEPAAKAIICFWTSPEWSLKMAYAGSNPGNLNGFKTKWMKERLDNIKFLDVTTSMLPYGIPFPALPQAPEIMNIIVPDMLQNALTGAMTVDQAADDAAAKGQGTDGRALGPGLSRTRPAALALPAITSHQDRGLAYNDHGDRRGRPGPPAQRDAFRPAAADLDQHRHDYLYVLPAIVVMLVVIAYPIYYTIDLSFFKTPPGLQLKDKNFIGLDNYTAILTSAVFWRVTLNTVIWTLASTVIAFVLGFALALALHGDFFGRGVLRAIFIIPWVISAVAASYIWKWIYHSDFGIIGAVLVATGTCATGHRTSSTASARFCPR